jgi:hypothetical protein
MGEKAAVDMSDPRAVVTSYGYEREGYLEDCAVFTTMQCVLGILYGTLDICSQLDQPDVSFVTFRPGLQTGSPGSMPMLGIHGSIESPWLFRGARASNRQAGAGSIAQSVQSVNQKPNTKPNFLTLPTFHSLPLPCRVTSCIMHAMLRATFGMAVGLKWE